MKNILNIIFSTSVLVILLWVVALILLESLPIEFTNDNIENMFYQIGFFCIPFCILMTLIKTVEIFDNWGMRSVCIIMTIILSFFSLICIVILSFGGMCTYVTVRILFENQKNSNIKIVERSFGCGATDNTPPTYSIFETKEITKDLIWVKSVDTTNINKNDWIRIYE